MEETSIKERFARTEEEREYLLRVRNPDNPCSKDPEEEITYSKETGQLVTSIVETPRTCFHYVKRTNRTVTNKEKKGMFNSEKSCAEVVKIVKNIDPLLYLKDSTSGVKIKDHVSSILHLTKSQVSLTQEEENLFKKALSRILVLIV